MPEEDTEEIAPDRGNLEDSFPGYYRPSSEARENAYKTGLVCFDANALLDLYRFTPNARNELFRVLDLIRTRIFIPHQAALEFHENRLNVVDDRIKAVEGERIELEKHLAAAAGRIRGFANRYQIGETQKSTLINMIDDLSARLVGSISELGSYDLNRLEVLDARDPVISRLSPLLQGCIGPAMTSDERREVLKEAAQRVADRIPPGYEDKKKTDPTERAGDFILWHQILAEASLRQQPVLLVCNETKPDWVRKGKNDEILGPRPELVLEMKKVAGVQLHTVTVVGLLKEAPNFLGAIVSPSTIEEAESLPLTSERNVSVFFAPKSRKEIIGMTDAEKKQFRTSLNRLEAGLKQDGLRYLATNSEVDYVDIMRRRGTVRFMWPTGLALASVSASDENTEDETIHIVVKEVFKTKQVDESGTYL